MHSFANDPELLLSTGKEGRLNISWNFQMFWIWPPSSSSSQRSLQTQLIWVLMCLRASCDPAEQGLLIHSVAEEAGSWAVQAEKCSHSSSWSSASVTTTSPHLLPGASLVFMALLWFCLTRVVAYQDVARKPGIWMTLAHSHFPPKLSLHLILLLSHTALSVPFLPGNSDF